MLNCVFLTLGIGHRSKQLVSEPKMGFFINFPEIKVVKTCFEYTTVKKRPRRTQWWKWCAKKIWSEPHALSCATCYHELCLLHLITQTLTWYADHQHINKVVQPTPATSFAHHQCIFWCRYHNDGRWPQCVEGLPPRCARAHARVKKIVEQLEYRSSLVGDFG